MKMIVVGQSSSALASSLAQHFNATFIPAIISHFADAEQSIKFDTNLDLVGATAYVVFQLRRENFSTPSSSEQSNNPESINDQLIGLLCLIDYLKARGVMSISVVMPYMPYGRQEVACDNTSPGAVYAIGRCLKSVGVDNLYACDLHEPNIVNKFPVTLHHIALTSLWTRTIQTCIVPHAHSWCIVSPDEGGRERAAAVADVLRIPCVFIRKIRTGADQVVTRELVGDVHSKNVIIIDDIVDTAGTVIGAHALLAKHGAKKIYGCFSHAIFAQGARERLLDVGFEQVFVTDTIINDNTQSIDQLSIVSMNEFLIRFLD